MTRLVALSVAALLACGVIVAGASSSGVRAEMISRAAAAISVEVAEEAQNGSGSAAASTNDDQDGVGTAAATRADAAVEADPGEVEFEAEIVEAEAEPEPEPELEPELPPEDLAGGTPWLRASLRTALRRTPLSESAELSVLVLDPEGRVVIAQDPEAQVLPASTIKLATSAAALDLLGGDFRFRTELRATAHPEPTGVLVGDLVLLGGGDPTLVTPRMGAEVVTDRPQTQLAALADAVVAAGITEVTGRVLGDPGDLWEEPLADGWPDRYLTNLYTARVSGLTVDIGRDVVAGNGGRLLGTASMDPPATTAAALVALLEERDVTVHGGFGTTHDGTSAGWMVGHVDSPPLLEILDWVVGRSDNHLADAVFRTLGVATGDGTWAGAARAVANAVAASGVDLEGAVLADGSGLSRSDRMSASQLVALDRARSSGADGEVWRSLQAVAAETGTLRRRLRGTHGAGQVRGKTGSLNDVRGLVGSADTRDGRYHFAVLGQGLDDADHHAVRALQDEFALLLVEAGNGCIRVGTPLDAPEPVRLVCR